MRYSNGDILEESTEGRQKDHYLVLDFAGYGPDSERYLVRFLERDATLTISFHNKFADDIKVVG